MSYKRNGCVDENGKKVKKESFDYDNSSKINVYDNSHGYHDEIEYNEYGYITKSHDVCNDMHEKCWNLRYNHHICVRILLMN